MAWWQPQQHPADGLEVAVRGDGKVLCSGMRVAEATLQPIVLADRSAAAGSVGKVDGFDRLMRCLVGGKPDQRPPVQGHLAAAQHVLPE